MFEVWCDGFVCAGEYRESSPLSDGEQRGSQLSHSMASTNQQILRELARDLMQVGLLTVLQEQSFQNLLPGKSTDRAMIKFD